MCLLCCSGSQRPVWDSLCLSLPQILYLRSAQRRPPLPWLESCDSALRLGISVTHTHKKRGKKTNWDHVHTAVKLYSNINFTKHKPPTPPWSLHALMMTPPTQVLSIVSRQRGGLAQTAAICRKHCAGHTLAASGSLISFAQLFPFVTVDCGWALCWGVGLWAGVGTGAGGVNRLCVCVCVCAINADTHTHSSNDWFLKPWSFSFSLKHYCTASGQGAWCALGSEM